MNLPPVSAKCWVAFAEGRVRGPFELLAVRVLAIRMRIAAQRNPSPEALRKRIEEVRAFFEDNEENARPDLQRIIEEAS